MASPSPFAAVTAMGALIAPAQLARIAAGGLPGQTAQAYGVPKGLTLRDELARFFRIGQAEWRFFAAVDAPGLAATSRFLESLFKSVLGFSDVNRAASPIEIGGRNFPIALTAGPIPIAVVPPRDAIDKPSDALGVQGRRRSAASLMQDYLNAEPAALWGLASNGRRVRLLRDNPSLTRPAFIEFDLAAIFDDEAYADFAALFLTLHRSRFAANDAACPLETWREEGAKAGAVARDKLRGGVEAALALLGQGFLEHPANTALAERLRSGDLPLADYFAALLRLVYRLIFLLAAEDRNLLHPGETAPHARGLYAKGYAVGRLRDRAVRRAAWDRHHDAWEGLCVVMAALGRGEPRLGLPALGGLFDPGSLPDLEEAKLSNAKLLEAIYRLAWLREASGPVPVNWRDMESEELGSVYEGLLELVPRLEGGGGVFAFASETAETKGNARKISGSYYTPDSLVQALLDSALNPLLEATVAGAEDPAAALLALTVLDPACGSGHFLLAAARRIAARLAAVLTGGSSTPNDYRHALREVMGACIHGVDRNPMAVELTKVALWIESLEPGKPLRLLDANIRCGDALLGLDDLSVLDRGIPDAAFAPLTGDDKSTAANLRKINKAERERPILSAVAYSPARLAAQAARVAHLPEETLEQVALKRRALADASWSPDSINLRHAADAWVAAFLAPKRPGALVPTTRHVWEATHGIAWHGPIVEEVERLARSARVFHWPLEFPAVLAGDQRGFDLVIGNPPWERIKLQEQEYFAARDPEIAAAPNAAVRGRMISCLATAEAPFKRALYTAFESAKRLAAATSAFSRIGLGGRYPMTGRGDINTYALFAESFSRLTGIRGRAGVIVPTGIATDATTAPFFAYLIEHQRLASLFDFENRAGLFPAVDSRMRFSLVTLGPDCLPAEFAFFLTAPDQLEDAARRFTLSTEQIAAINPNTGTAPVFRTRADADLTAQIYEYVPILINEAAGLEENPWQFSFATLFHMSNDSGHFRTAAQLAALGFAREGAAWVSPDSPRYVPLYEAKMIHQFDHRWATYSVGAKDSRDVTISEKQDPYFEPTPRYWVPQTDVADRLAAKSWTRDWLMGWRDIARGTDERSVIFDVFPSVGVGHTIQLILIAKDVRYCAAIYGNLNSLAVDYIARQKVGGTHLTYGYLNQFAVLPPSAYSPADLYFIVPRVLELTYTSHAMRAFARDLGYEGSPFAWNEDRRAHLRAELDAWYARAYGLSREQLRYVLDPADVMGEDYPSETFRVLKKNEIARFGYYRTQHLVLAEWDAQEAARASTARITPPITSLVDLSTLPDGDWARPGGPDLLAETVAQFAAVLNALPGPTPANQVRLAALYALDPRLLTRRLPDEDRRQWMRVVGTEATPTTGQVTTFGLGGAAGWGMAIAQLSASGALIIDTNADTWAPGAALSNYFTDSWPLRGAFTLHWAGIILSDESTELSELETQGLQSIAA